MMILFTEEEKEILKKVYDLIKLYSVISLGSLDMIIEDVANENYWRKKDVRKLLSKVTGNDHKAPPRKIVRELIEIIEDDNLEQFVLK